MLEFDPTSYFTRRQSDARYVRIPTPPPAPTNLVLTGSGIATTLTSETAYLIFSLTPPVAPNIVSMQFLATGGGQSISQIIPLYGTGPYQLNELALNVPYTISVRAIDSFGQTSDYTPTQVITTPADTTPPATPSITANPSPTGCLITIGTLNVEPDFAYYELYRSTSTDMAGAILMAKFTGIAYQDISIPSSGNYYYQVSAWDVYGNHSLSNIVGPVALTTTTLPLPPYPDMALGTITANLDGSITITWPAVVMPGSETLSFWRIWRNQTGIGWVLINTIVATPGLGGTYKDTLTIGGVTYSYAVEAVNSVGGGSGYNPADVLTTTAATLPAPNPPTNIRFQGGPGSVIVTWTPSTSPYVQFYAVNYSMTYSPLDWQPTDILVAGSTFTLYGLTELRTALTDQLTFRVAAVDATLAQSTYLTDTVTFTDLAGYQPASTTPPTSPDPVLTNPNNDDSISIGWQAPNGNNNIWGYRIDVFKDPGFGIWELLKVVKDSVTGNDFKVITDTGLVPYAFSGVTYRYRVFTIDTTGNISSFNALDNPGFEYNLRSWTPAVDAGNISNIVTSPVEGGGQSLNANYAGRVYQVLPVLEGLTYAFSAYVAQDSVPGAIAKIRWEWLDASSILISQDTATIATIGSFLRVSIGPFPAPIGAAYIKLSLEGDPSNTTTTFFWDDVQFEESPVITPYADGKSEITKAVDTLGPEVYPGINLIAAPGIGQIKLTWNNPTSGDTDSYMYIRSVFEVWRAPDVAGSPGTFVQIAEVPGNNNGAINGYTDLDPVETSAVKYWYNLKGKDQYNNEGVYLVGTPVTATSLNLDTYLVSGSGRFLGDYTNTLDYVPGDEVNYLGGLYIALAINGPGTAVKLPTDTLFWQLVGTAIISNLGSGPLPPGTTTAGNTPISTWYGAWSSIVNYPAGAEVTYNGNYYQSKNPNLNDTPPSSNWTLVGPDTLDNIANGAYTKTRFLGVWDAAYETGTGYQVGDEVMYPTLAAGNYYSCLVNVTSGSTPDTDPTHWQIVGPSYLAQAIDTSGNLKLKNIAFDSIAAGTTITGGGSIVGMTIAPGHAGINFNNTPFGSVLNFVVLGGSGDASGHVASLSGGVVASITELSIGTNYIGVTNPVPTWVDFGIGYGDWDSSYQYAPGHYGYPPTYWVYYTSRASHGILYQNTSGTYNTLSPSGGITNGWTPGPSGLQVNITVGAASVGLPLVASPSGLTITTKGNDVLVLATMLLQKYINSLGNSTSVSIHRKSGAIDTPIYTFPGIDNLTTISHFPFPLSIMFVDTGLPAGTYTYLLYATIPAGTGITDTVSGGTLQLVELG